MDCATHQEGSVPPAHKHHRRYARMHADTMNLPDGLLEQVRARAAASGRTTTSLVEEALRLLLQTPDARSETTLVPTYGKPGGRLLVDIEDRDALWAALDERP